MRGDLFHLDNICRHSFIMKHVFRFFKEEIGPVLLDWRQSRGFDKGSDGPTSHLKTSSNHRVEHEN